jgi:Kef-type K+ transport system membrane component KefB
VTNLGAHDLTTMFFALAVLLGAAKLAGEVIQKLGHPAILGEISAGILLGPTVLGRFQPQWYAALFPSTGPVPIMIGTVTTLGLSSFFWLPDWKPSCEAYSGRAERRCLSAHSDL